MIKDLLTIVIPTKDCVNSIKETIENLTTKTKISKTRVLVLDFGSKDGSFQYVAQASSEFIRFLRIESIRMKEGEEMTIMNDVIDTPYIMVIKPGSVSDDKDIIINSVNKILSSNETIVYIKDLGIINRVFKTSKNKSNPSLLFSKKEILCEISYNPEDPDQNISIERNQNVIVNGFIKS